MKNARASVSMNYHELFPLLPFRGLPAASVIQVNAIDSTDAVNLRLESAMIITVDPGAPAQNAHVDTQDEGSVSVHIPLHSLHDGHLAKTKIW